MTIYQPLPDDKMKALLTPPSQDEQLRVVVDSDLDNEIDDLFALTWLLLPNPNVKVEAVYAAPFSFRSRLFAMLRAQDLLSVDQKARTRKEQDLVSMYQGQIAAIRAHGYEPQDFLNKGNHVAIGPREGMKRSYHSICAHLKLMGADTPVFKGADRYIQDGCPVRSDAVKHLIDLARGTPDDKPIYVMGLACATNLASAVMLAPDIREKVVMAWTAGYPTNVTDLTNTSFNLSQDVFAAQVLFHSGVPLVYLPGFYIGQQLTLSQPDMQAWFQGSGKVGEALYCRYMNNPLFDWYGIDKQHLFGRVWNIWDLINIAWFLNPGSVPSRLVRAPTLTDNRYWKPNPEGHWMRENSYTLYNAIFPKFAKQLQDYAKQ